MPRKMLTASQAVKHLKKQSGTMGWQFHCINISTDQKKHTQTAVLIHKGNPKTLPNGKPVTFTVKMIVNRRTGKVRMEMNFDYDPFQDRPANAAEKVQLQQEKDEEASEKVAQELMKQMAAQAMTDGKDIDDYEDEDNGS